jgi:hypothetical protein
LAIFKPVKPVMVLCLIQSIIAKCLFNHLVSCCSTLAKFEAKFDANTLLLHVHHFNGKKNLKMAQTRRYKNA